MNNRRSGILEVPPTPTISYTCHRRICFELKVILAAGFDMTDSPPIGLKMRQAARAGAESHTDKS